MGPVRGNGPIKGQWALPRGAEEVRARGRQTLVGSASPHLRGSPGYPGIWATDNLRKVTRTWRGRQGPLASGQRKLDPQVGGHQGALAEGSATSYRNPSAKVGEAVYMGVNLEGV